MGPTTLWGLLLTGNAKVCANCAGIQPVSMFEIFVVSEAFSNASFQRICSCAIPLKGIRDLDPCTCSESQLV